jgi:hypothetical protein
MAGPSKTLSVSLLVLILICVRPSLGQPQQPAQPPPHETSHTGMIRGTVVDRTGAVIPGARVNLAGGAPPVEQETVSNADGQFSFSNLGPGPFHLIVSASGFAGQTVSGSLLPGENQLYPPIELVVARADTSVNVAVTQEEIAQDQIKEQEQQRVLKVIPNFYVSYAQDPVPLNAKQKFELAWKTMMDPFSFLAVGAIAGVQQSQNNFAGYGQGAQGYAKRYGASYGDFVSGTLIGAAILPSLFKQDPRYFYKGTGSKKSRILYALANSVMCKGDNRKWQANYSAILGNLAAGGLSNLYYPAADRNGARLTLGNTAIGIGAAGAINIFEEFIVRKPRGKVLNHEPAAR